MAAIAPALDLQRFTPGQRDPGHREARIVPDFHLHDVHLL
jgi:hypothetical protein